jgi:hypothetical protein
MADKKVVKKDMPEWAKLQKENAEKDEYTEKAQETYHKIMPNPEMKKKGGKISEYGGKEKYASKAAMKKHEKAESPAEESMEMKKYGRGETKAKMQMRGYGMARGGKVCKMR